MSSLISICAKVGLSIPPNRLIRLTGNRNGPLWEVDLPAPGGKRIHAVALPVPSGTITDKIFGQARTFGPLVEVQLAKAVDFDDALSVAADGRAQKAGRADRNRSGVALAKMAAGAVCPVLIGWSQFP